MDSLYVERRHIFVPIWGYCRCTASLASLIDLRAAKKLSPFPKMTHFTLVDIKAPVLARDLILLAILAQLAAIDPAEHLTNIEAVEVFFCFVLHANRVETYFDITRSLCALTWCECATHYL
jgi:hypothetical protein